MYTQKEIDDLANFKYQYHIRKISENVVAIRELTLKLKEVGKQEDLIKLNDLINKLGEDYAETLEYFKNIEEDSYNTSYKDLIFEVSDRIPNKEKVLKLEQDLAFSRYKKASLETEKENDFFEEKNFPEEDGSKVEKVEKLSFLNKVNRIFDKIFA